VGIDEETKETFGVFSRARQLFDYARLAAVVSVAKRRVGSNVGDVNAVRSSIPSLKKAASRTRRVVEVVRNVGKSSAVGIYVEMLCHGGHSVSRG
jgi:hypothetical protein